MTGVQGVVVHSQVHRPAPKDGADADEVVTGREKVDHSEFAHQVNAVFFVDHDTDHHSPSTENEAFVASQVHGVDHQLENLACSAAQLKWCVLVIDRELAVAQVSTGRGRTCPFFPNVDG